jgi:three-Cys-motif partner protein
MAEKRYEWFDGATLEEHSRRKHKILREYFQRYMLVRCQIPKQTRFRLAIVDGFAGGGRYKCGAPGSPIIFLEELKGALEAVNIQRGTQGLGTIEIECLLVLNDASFEALEVLRHNLAPILAEISESTQRLHVRVEYLNSGFEAAFLAVRKVLAAGRFRNVVFNLDQCGHSHVDRQILVEIMRTYPSVEIFYTFAIEALLAFLQKSDPMMLATQLRHIGVSASDLAALTGTMSKGTWLGTAERIVFEAYRACAPYVSPFSINNPNGWHYWLIHFANVYRARQVYNNVLHDNSSMQAHFGRSGLNMLSYDPRHDNGSLYLFDVSGRQQAIGQLLEDIPRLVAESGDVLEMIEFYESIYNATPAHADDVHRAIIDNPDIEVLTPAGGERRKANTIAAGDVLRLKNQKSFFPLFMGTNVLGGQ